MFWKSAQPYNRLWWNYFCFIDDIVPASSAFVRTNANFALQNACWEIPNPFWSAPFRCRLRVPSERFWMCQYKLSPKIRVAFWCKRQWHNSDVRGRIGALCAWRMKTERTMQKWSSYIWCPVRNATQSFGMRMVCRKSVTPTAPCMANCSTAPAERKMKPSDCVKIGS